MTEELKSRINSYIEEHASEMLADLAEIIAVPSEFGTPEPGAPRGIEIRQALDTMLGICSHYGFETANFENRIGWATLQGSDSSKYVAAISHLDVVPAGNGWDSDPYALTLNDGWLIGRGTADDKGAAIATLYALRFIKDAGIPLRYETRVMFGTSEETSMDEDLGRFLKSNPAPAIAFTPDTSFPISYAEKGHAQGTVSTVRPLENIISFKGGVAKNAVADKAVAVVKCAKALEPAEGIEVEDLGDGTWRITGHGISKHACMPSKSVNAIGAAVNYMMANGLLGEYETEYFNAILPLLTGIYGEAYGLNLSDDIFRWGHTIIGGTIDTSDGVITQTFDSRLITGMTSEQVVDALQSYCGSSAAVELTESSAVFNMGKDNPVIQGCLEAYKEISGDTDSKLFSSAGATYASHLPNGFAAGPCPYRRTLPPFVGGLHSKNEGISFEQLKLAAKVYVAMLLELQEHDYEA